eukprot:CAMPEP_0196580960 /NCGR_PEP_ID=MMETSP1081-20130531/31738_1 /TAXON_ID=36882 /ORGANISM="Pyramimonas amylifera, Strain CCMP720" /LENGTH=374 /DNA_ID=CAMNT_0041901017 /DNA_START=299 /DNA_END=1423 /DNA_ORIENTATION=+
MNVGDKVTRNNDNRVERALRSKCAQTSKLKGLLEETLAKTNNELSKMESIKKHLTQERHRFNMLYQRNQERRGQRGNRPGRELVRDQPLKELKRETDVLARSIEKSDEKLQDVANSMSRLNKLKALLKSDLADKSHALDLDRKCLDMVATDGAQAAASLPDSVTTGLPFGWKRDTYNTLDASREAHRVATKTRKDAFHVTNTQKMRTKDQYDVVQAALANRLKTVTAVNNQLKDQLANVDDEISKLMKAKKDLETAIRDKMPPLNLARQRYVTRTRRPRREAVFDEVEHALLLQYNELKEIVVELQKKLQTVVGRLTNLKQQKQSLETNIEDKVHCIKMDHVCRAMAPSRPGTAVSMRSSNLSLYSVGSEPAEM